MKYRLITTLLIMCAVSQVQAQELITVGTEIQGSVHTIRGKVLDDETRELLPGVNIVVKETGKGAVTDINGTYRIENLNFGKIYTLQISSIGYEAQTLNVLVKGNGPLRIELKSTFVELDEVVVSGQAEDINVTSNDIGKNVLKLESIKELPQIAGEVDIFKTITLLPGVSTNGEASAGVNVRGGGLDQNLVLFGGIPLYNPTHLFGFFSSVNSDAIDQIELYKGVIPVNYGGRSSSVLKMSPAMGSLDKWSGKLQLGIISSKVKVDGPIVRDKLSLSTSFRTSYLNWLLGLSNQVELRNSSASFYDGNASLQYRINDNNVVSYTFYRSYDKFNLASDTSNSWINQGQELKWKHSFNQKLFAEISLVDAFYEFTLANEVGLDQFDLNSRINNRIGTLTFNYQLNDNNTIMVGAQTTYHEIDPGELIPGDGSPLNYRKIENEQALESAVFFSHDFQFTDKFSINYGLRFNDYRFLGPKSVNTYEEIVPRSVTTITDTESFESGESIFDHNQLAPRVGLRYSFTESSSLKLGYNVANQFIQVVSNTANISPVNIWKLSDGFTGAQLSTQYSAGFFKNFDDNTFETSVEGYYKDYENLIEYKDGAQLILNDNIETDLLTAEGYAYGLEFYVSKRKGKLNGWVSYTYSRSFRRVINSFPEAQINNGEEFPSNFDKPHDFTSVLNYKPNPFFSLGVVLTYNTGRPVTYPAGKFEYNNQQVAYFNTRNESRIPDYHRLDLSLTFKSRSPKKLLSGEWNFTVYNVYGRQNAYSVFFDDRPGSPPQAYRLAVLNSPFPSLSYSLNIN